MKAPRNFAGLFTSIAGFLGAILVLTGCETEQPYMPVAGVPGIPSSMASAPAAPVSVGAGTNSPSYYEVFHRGDLVAVMRVAGDIKFDPWSEHIRDDGMITPPEIGPVKAAERTPSDVQREMQLKYEKIYRGITVTVTVGERYYNVVGEVNVPGFKPYVTRTDILQAISSAGGITEFGSYNMKLFHPDGKSYDIDYKKALAGNPDHNRQIYPGDKIVVKRRWL